MRIFIISLVLLLGLMAALGGYMVFLKNTTADLLDFVDAMDAAAREENWVAAHSVLEEAFITWETVSPNLALFITHELIDEITHTFAEAKGYFYFRESAEFMAETETLRVLIEHIEEREAPTLHNIF